MSTSIARPQRRFPAALFAVLATEQWRSRKSAAPLWVALVAYALAYPLAVKHALVISIALSIVAGVVWQSRAAQQSGARHD